MRRDVDPVGFVLESLQSLEMELAMTNALKMQLLLVWDGGEFILTMLRKAF
jgi:hypothetical protein